MAGGEVNFLKARTANGFRTGVTIGGNPQVLGCRLGLDTRLWDVPLIQDYFTLTKD